MRDHVWWKQLYWPEYGSELLGTAFLVFAGVSAVVFVWYWLYWVAPPLGALLAVGAFRLLSAGGRDVLTGKLFHAPHYRSVFMHVSAPCMPANGRLRKTR